MSTAFVYKILAWLGDSALGHFMQDYSLPSSLAIVLHLLGLILLGGSSLITGLAALGWVVRQPPAADVARELWPFFQAGLALTFVTGVALVAAKGVFYYDHGVFWLKLGLLVPAIAVSLLLHRHLQRAAAGPIVRSWRVVTAINLLLWTGVTVAGRGIGLY